jgi:hypothetical protein
LFQVVYYDIINPIKRKKEWQKIKTRTQNTTLEYTTVIVTAP